MDPIVGLEQSVIDACSYQSCVWCPPELKATEKPVVVQNHQRAEAIAMASNFKISIQRNEHDINMKLFGDFDGTSAHQLIDILKKDYKGIGQIVIDTRSLKRIDPFGSAVFHVHSKDIKNIRRLKFTGNNSRELDPQFYSN